MQYNESVNKFVTNLIKISLTLKTIDIEERKEKLNFFIKKANKILKNNRTKVEKEGNNSFNLTYYYQGIVLPFSNFQEVPYSSNLVIKILIYNIIYNKPIKLDCKNSRIRFYLF